MQFLKSHLIILFFSLLQPVSVYAENTLQAPLESTIINDHDTITDDDIEADHPEFTTLEEEILEEEILEVETPEIETETTVDNKPTDIITGTSRYKLNGDIRATFTTTDVELRDGLNDSNKTSGFRLRLRADWSFTDSIILGARLAGTCFSAPCNLDFVTTNTPSGINGLKPNEFAFDELYLHWFKNKHASVAVGRLQTRFVLRGGVYAKSLDRNNSNNVNINWTNGLQTTFRADNGWDSSFIVEYNDKDGSGSIRHSNLNFETDSSRQTFFTGFENLENWGYIVQRAVSLSYLPDALLLDGDTNGRRENYSGIVTRLAARIPNKTGIRLRLGTEIGFAPTTPTADTLRVDDTSGLAWNAVASLIDFQPNHSIGLNYGRTGAGWLLSPQYNPNEELIEVRYMWRPVGLPLFEARIRRRNEIQQLEGETHKRNGFDIYFRFTWEFSER